MEEYIIPHEWRCVTCRSTLQNGNSGCEECEASYQDHVRLVSKVKTTRQEAWRFDLRGVHEYKISQKGFFYYRWLSWKDINTYIDRIEAVTSNRTFRIKDVGFESDYKRTVVLSYLRFLGAVRRTREYQVMGENIRDAISKAMELTI